MELGTSISPDLRPSGNLVKIYDPRSSTSASTPRTQFSCNGRAECKFAIIVSILLRRAFWRFIPLPNRLTSHRTLSGKYERSNDAWKLFLRIDHSVGKHHFFLLGASK